MSTLPFVVKFAATLAIGWALYILLLIVACAVWMARQSRSLAPTCVTSFEQMDDEAFVAIDNHRRARVMSESGHLPPRLTRHRVQSVRAAEDCQ